MRKYIYLALAVLLVLCLLPMPYGFYLLVRFVAMCVFGWFAYENFDANNKPFGVIYLALALLFQPFLKLSLGREIWQIVDAIVAVFLLWQWTKLIRNK
jgi:hypothetical protein